MQSVGQEAYMKKLRYGIALGGLLCSVTMVGAGLKLTKDGTTSGAEPDFEAMVKGYRTWTRVNSEPFRMEPAVSWLCAAPAAGQVSPHDAPDAYIDVYVNPAGRSAMMTQGRVSFPVGSIIVKEKRHTLDRTDPELLTVMLKRERGYNPETGDWDFAALDGKAVIVQAQGKLENCIRCHKMVPASDYVFRPYLPNNH
jgi:hypothetical protein